MAEHVVRCRGPYGGEVDGTGCGEPARFEVVRYRRPHLYVCPVHLGPALLLAEGVLWPPEIRLVA
ncbi:hypothetical protein JS756_23145 [Streptomyces actuosus]|uniref:Rieske domain-containing protein n=1 Tax=Streptomyces actuosus TaxID=1885 RepID=A0ABS2VV70_STRAS|nr:hypothetical protein [Streptomyces actuosus]MBN0046958.1 hypothetical protein [Streptomyces actuosus]